MYSLDKEKDYQCNFDKECLLVCSIISVLNILFVGATIYLMQKTGDISLSAWF